MSPARFDTVTSRYPSLRILLLGDFCLDRYLEIDPARSEISIETGLPVRNVIRVRSQPGGSGTILSNLVALGVGTIHAVGFCGDDGEGYELRRALRSLHGAQTGHFLATTLRRTFTYCKPLVIHPDAPPEELNRLDSKNWDATPSTIEDQLIDSVRTLAPAVDAVIVLDQVDLPDTGVVTRRVRESLADLARDHPGLLILADSRQGLAAWPPVGFKMNAAELGALLGSPAPSDPGDVQRQASELARRNQQPVFVTLSERGIVGALPSAPALHVPSLPVRGPIDIVGAGDSVTANLTTALAAGADPREAMELAMAGANEVIHQLGTTGTASVAQLRERLVPVLEPQTVP
ncbi:MAG: bifunctional heptose 7-phosphate kinase/heptose 1-phosphate adenyltransferase [Limisphaerales bacterium]